MSRLRSILCAVLAAALTFTAALPAAATYSDVENATISYRDVKLKIDGIDYVPHVGGTVIEPFLLDGTTYLPVRAVANAFGREVAFDSATNTVELGAQSPTYFQPSVRTGQNLDKRVTLCYRDVKLTVEGVPYTPTDLAGKVVEPFIIDGVTYLPLRAVANALGVAVDWDGSTNTVLLGEQLSGNLYSQSSPAPLGISQQVLGVTADGVRYTARISVQRTVTGNEALQLLIGADIQNPPPPAGMRYGLARVTFSLDRTSDGSAISVDPTDFDIYSFRGDDYADCIVTPPYPAFGGTLLPGQSISGYVPYLVRESEQRPLLSIDANYDGTGDIWLALR